MIEKPNFGQSESMASKPMEGDAEAVPVIREISMENANLDRLARKLVSHPAVVKRSSGDVEADWYIVGFTPDRKGVFVNQREKVKGGIFARKAITVEQFKEFNPGI